jgi:hypothetical protein
MAKLLAIVAFFGVAIFFLVSELVHRKSPPPPAAVEADARPAPPPPLPVMRRPTTATTPATTAGPTVEKLATDSAALRNRLDEQIPRQLYAEAARCYRDGLDKDKRLDLTYHLRIKGGEVSVGNLRTLESTLDDAALEGCIRDHLLAKKWRDDALPDLEKDDDLYMRVGELKNNVASAER